jgi:hypothetical protein
MAHTSEMSDGSSDLAARALAAAATGRAEQEEQARRERAQAYYQARRAAAATASEVLGYPVPPKRSEVEWYRISRPCGRIGG